MDRCVSCQFYDRNQRNGDAKASAAGQCRRSAPMLSPLNQKSYMIEGVWPTVRDDDWCGEFRLVARRGETSRLADAMAPAMSMSSMMPPSALPAGAARQTLPGTGNASSLASASVPMHPRVSVQAARAALSSLGIESRAPSVAPPQSLVSRDGD